MLQESWETSNASSLGERFLTSRVSVSQRNVVVRVLQIWENKDQAKNVDELGFIVVGQLVPTF
jgi:hypothetical protein